jgi:hypothetical protein
MGFTFICCKGGFMKRIKTGLMVFAATLMLVQALPVGAEVYFPVKQYNKPKGAPATYSETFVVPAGSYDHYILVKNGADGNEVKNISIEINGQEVVATADMKVANPLRKPISLEQLENVMTITLRGQGGNAAFVEIGGTTPPVSAPLPPRDLHQ